MENYLLFNKNVLIIEDKNNNLNDILSTELNTLKQTFFGTVVDVDNVNNVNNVNDQPTITPTTIVYLLGNIQTIYQNPITAVIQTAHMINVIRELSNNYDNNSTEYSVVGLGEVPINIHNVGIYFREFVSGKNYFEIIENRHRFQTLTESNKPNLALRRGIYLTTVTEDDDGVYSRLLRCSSNFEGATDNFRDVDHELIAKVNSMTRQLMSNPAEINHVLAQIYYNTAKTKARISPHSDKSKDMPSNAIIGFLTLYDNFNAKLVKKSKTSLFDYCYKETSVLTQLVFKLKDCVNDDTLVKEFTVTLYPNSLFVIPLSTNRLYTHEIRPSTLPPNYLPTRMGYVMRCSNTRAVYKDDQTYIIDSNNNLVKLGPMTRQNVSNLRTLYFLENTTADIIDYGFIDFSMNSGDYLKPYI